MSKKPFLHKRVIAYFVDILIISMITTIIYIPFNKTDDYTNKAKELNEVVDKFQKKEIEEDEYLNLYNDINYELAKINVNQTIIMIIISVVYFIIFNYYNNGQTVGKKLMKIKIVSSDESPLTINSYVIRTLVSNTALSNIVSVVLILFLSKEKYLLYNEKITMVFGFIYLICFVLALYRNDGRGLHDFLAGTIVINEKNDENKQKDDSKKTLEALVIEEKENVEKDVK